MLPLLTTDAQGYPRAAYLTPGEVRANSATELAVAVPRGSRTAANLIRRRQATLLFLSRRLTATVQLAASRARVSRSDPRRRLFPLSVVQVSLDRPDPREGEVFLSFGPTFGGRDAGRLFTEELFEELGRTRCR